MGPGKCVSISMSTIQVVRRHRVQRAPACNDDTPSSGVGMEWGSEVFKSSRSMSSMTMLTARYWTGQFRSSIKGE